MASVIHEVEGGLLTRPALPDVIHDRRHFSIEFLEVCIEDDLAGALLEVDAFEALHHVLLVFEHVGQVSKALELLNFTQLLVLLVEEETRLQVNWLEKTWRFSHFFSYICL